MAEDGARARGENCGHPGSVPGDEVVAHRVYAVMDAMKPARVEPVLDRPGAQPKSEQLSPRNPSVLAASDGCDLGVPTVSRTFCTHGVQNVRFARHGPSLATRS
jgi:hypothetical protein